MHKEAPLISKCMVSSYSALPFVLSLIIAAGLRAHNRNNLEKLHSVSLLSEKALLLPQLISPEIAIFPDLLSVADVLRLDPLIDFQVSFNKDGKTYGLNPANRRQFDSLREHLTLAGSGIFYTSSVASNIPELSWKPKPFAKYTIVFLDMDCKLFTTPVAKSNRPTYD